MHNVTKVHRCCLVLALGKCQYSQADEPGMFTFRPNPESQPYLPYLPAMAASAAIAFASALEEAMSSNPPRSLALAKHFSATCKHIPRHRQGLKMLGGCKRIDRSSPPWSQPPPQLPRKSA